MHVRIGTLVAGLALFALATPLTARATILTFDQTRDQSGTVVPATSSTNIQDDYGDRVTGLSVAVPGGFFTYGEAGEGFTPNVVADFFSGSASSIGPGVALWEDGYGDLVNVLFANNNSEFLAVRLTADPGFLVGLYGFDVGGWFNTDYTIDAVRVLSGANVLFEQTNALIEGNFTGPRHTAFEFAAPLFAAELLIEIDYGNLLGGQHDNLGIDNIRFGQDPPASPPTDPNDPPGPSIPEPATLTLFGVALAAGLYRARAV